jgi:hypothetical protein
LVCVLACGCTDIAEGILGAILPSVILPAPTVYGTSEETVTAPRLAFVTHGSGGVHCYILDNGGSDPVMDVYTEPTGIAVGTTGAIFVSTAEDVVGLDAEWSDADTMEVPVTTVDDVAADAGTVVVAARSDEGAVVLVYDEMSGALVGRSEPVPGVTIADVTVSNGTAFVIEMPAGEIVAYDLATPVPAREPVTDAVPGDPVALVASGSGSLLVATTEGRVEEVDPATGETEGTVYSWSPALAPVDLAFDPEREHILLLTEDDIVRVIDDKGRVVETRADPAVRDATAVAFQSR